MPYTSEHKNASHKKILASAYELFSERGYEAVTIDDVMANCKMTRGAFYGHFKSKAELYRVAIGFAFANSKLVSSRDAEGTPGERLTDILSGYLSIEHVRGKNPCPLAFLTTDITMRDHATRRVFSEAYANVNDMVFEYAGSVTGITREEVFPLTAMVIGTVALARTISDDAVVEAMLAACRAQVGERLGIDL